MRIEQRHWIKECGWLPLETPSHSGAGLVLLFGGSDLLRSETGFAELRAFYPKAHFLGCSTSGEVLGTHVHEDSLVSTAVTFEHTRIHSGKILIAQHADSFEAGAALSMALPQEGLSHVLVLADGLKVNGSELVKGMREHLPANVKLTGALAGDGTRFQQTFVVCGSDAPAEGVAAALGFYGSRLRVELAAAGGWFPFGPERLITRAQGNILYELDGEPALHLYKTYLGEHAAELPASAFHFPLRYLPENGAEWLVRTVVGIDENAQSMIFAGDLTPGGRAQLMHNKTESLLQCAGDAAQACLRSHGGKPPQLALAFSCVGRKIVLKQRTEEEIEAATPRSAAIRSSPGFTPTAKYRPSTPAASVNCTIKRFVSPRLPRIEPVHPLLQRQIERFLGTCGALPEPWQRFLAAVDEIYRQNDSDYRLLERALDLSSKELLKKNEELRRYAQELKETNHDLRDFAALASHDLREPLRKVMVFGSRLSGKHGLNGEGKTYLERMLAATERMQRLIDDLLQFSQVSMKARQIEEVNMEEVMQEALTDLEAVIARTGGKVAVEMRENGAPLAARADRIQMRHLFQNLIANGLKFHKENEAPAVTVKGHSLPGDPRHPHKGVEVQVRDNGIGFDEKYLPRIFRPFERLHNTKIYEGSGMGLSICKKIVARHGGTLTAASAPGQGATFIVQLPGKPAHHEH